ncbi:MAG: efflux RND transporter permease subunit, partial [Pseudomonadota bacterium]
GIKGGLVIDLIVPIAMVSLGVDFAIHAVRRYREERGLGLAPRRALAVGMAGVLSALVLALLSDSIAFLSNTTSGIEAVIHFGLAAAIAVAASFIVLGVALPLALMHVELLHRPAPGPATRLGRVLKTMSSAGVAALAGTAVILLIAVSVPFGLAMLAALIGTMIIAPYLWLRRRHGRERGPDSQQGAATGDEGAAPARRLARLSEALARLAELRLVTLPVAAAITAVAVFFALRLEATFDAKDFFDSGSDFVVSLDKFDEHLGSSMGEPAIVFVEGDLADPGAVAAFRGLMDRMQRNNLLARGSDGLLIVSEPNLTSILEGIVAGDSARGQVMGATGVAITDDNEDRIPDSREQIEAVLDYAVDHGVPGSALTPAYGPEQVRMALSHDPAGRHPDATVLTVFVPGTREQSTVLAARRALQDDMKVLSGVPGITRTGLTGSPFARQEQLQASVDSMQTSMPIAAAGAFVLLLLAMRSLRFAVVTIIPIGLVVGWLYGLMYAGGFALNFVTATIGAVSIGVGIDYSIHMTERFREELRRSDSKGLALRKALDGTGVALAASALSSIVGFAIMGFAPMPMFATYGILTAIMIFLALAASLAVLPSLLLLVTPEPAAHTAPPAAPAD